MNATATLTRPASQLEHLRSAAESDVRGLLPGARLTVRETGGVRLVEVRGVARSEMVQTTPPVLLMSGARREQAPQETETGRRVSELVRDRFGESALVAFIGRGRAHAKDAPLF